MPLISVVIPTYNAARYLPATLQSVLAQTLQDVEIIVVDDGSTDDTEAVVQGLKSKKIFYLKQPNSGGPSQPRNVGIRAARGKYISIFDSDDLMLPHKLAESAAFLEDHPHLGFIFTNFVVCNEQGEDFAGTFLDTYAGFWNLPKTVVGTTRSTIDGSAAYENLFSENYIGTSGVVIPKDVLMTVGGFDETLAGPEDRDMWFRITKRYDVGFLDIIGHRYRRHHSGITGRGPKVLAPQRIRVFKKQMAEGLPSGLARRAQSSVAQELFRIGYWHQSCGELREARQQYLLSFRVMKSWRALRGIAVSFLGGRCVGRLRELRSTTRGRIQT
jgi:glycosyltransferase involved in cell wall biosynthesis